MLWRAGVQRSISTIFDFVIRFRVEDSAVTIRLVAIAVITAAVLAGCGSSTQDRALSGAGIGAGVGAVGGLLVGHPVTGAVLGGAAGAAGGALTSESDINLGKPIWRR